MADSRKVRVAVVGAGVSGICATIKLKEQFGANADIVVIEKDSDLGGTWYCNHYPGAACDVPSCFYSFSFAPNPKWTQYYSPQGEIYAYLKAVATKYGVVPHIRFNTEFVGGKWDDAQRKWLVRTKPSTKDWSGHHSQQDASGAAGGAGATASAVGTPSKEVVESFDVLVVSSAALNRPAIPSFPGLTSFEGKVMHTAQWDDAFKPDGKRIAVVGTGASAVQVIPSLAPTATSLSVFQRTPGWVIPRRNFKYNALITFMFTWLPFTLALYRLFQWAMRDLIFFHAFKRGSIPERFVRWMSERHMRNSVGGNEELLKKVIPDYPPGCKRLLVADDYLSTLTKPNVSLVTSAIKRVTPTGIVTDDGKEHTCDTIVMATGFQVTSFLAHVDIQGRGGQSLSERWANPDNVEAFYGTQISGCPNFFVLMGPNTALGHSSMIFIIETQVQYMCKVLAEMVRKEAKCVDVPQAAQAKYNAWLQKDLSATVWAGSCQSWYKTATGKIVTLWPHSTLRFYLTLSRPKYSEMEWS